MPVHARICDRRTPWAFSHVLFGTDFPFRPGTEAVAGVSAHGFSAADLRAVGRDNALALLPRLRDQEKN